MESLDPVQVDIGVGHAGLEPDNVAPFDELRRQRVTGLVGGGGHGLRSEGGGSGREVGEEDHGG